MRKNDFLNYLSTQLDMYQQLPVTDINRQNETKIFINGLMTASRFFGISYSELQEIIPRDLRLDENNIDSISTTEDKSPYKDLSSPTFHRQGKRVIGLYKQKD
ncbi:hypothetical protein [Vibrio crassostreae]|uniref:hypothetical protein n=1 Tax=Vibrio crassostreae TaxID=246167 RepID=UPI001B30E1E9|nr:hypothetical protein [Vibrio crassostreae]